MISVIQFVWIMAGTLIAFIFGLGVVYNKMQTDIGKAKGDVNALGKKYGRLVSLLILWADTDERRAQLSRAVEPQW